MSNNGRPNDPNNRAPATPKLGFGLVALLFVGAGIFGLVKQQPEMACLDFILGGLSMGLGLPGVMRQQPLFVRIFLGVFAVAAAYVGWICFLAGGILIVLPGLQAAFGAGQILGMFLRWNPPAD